jgi:D-alanyl-lipoteichoic acid acyltransferase DltB (MBOAT superfamily)
MLFNSLEFIIFLPVVFLLYWFVFRKLRYQNLFVVIASYVFYGWWDWRFLFLIAFTSLCSYLSGILLEKWEGNRRRQQAVSASNIVLNLFILAVFKYYNFFMENMAALFSSVGYELDWATLNIILPVGISFYTFQALSYTIDVYRHNIRATHDPVEFFAYISFFPQLVAGPIERATNLLPQFQGERRFDYAKAVDGCRQMLWGFLKKLVVADGCAAAANIIWSNYEVQPGIVLFIGALLFTFQIYGDFSGYSDIAIGCSRLFGFDLKRNFNYPYFSRDISEFWRRWHISLMTWFRDYIYFPLGGSRCSMAKSIRNTIIVFGVSGLWHGANWTFVAWGLYHAFLLAMFMLLGWNVKYTDDVAAGRALPSLKETGQMLSTFVLAVFGWILFRAETIGQAYEYIVRMLTPSAFTFSNVSGAGVLINCLVVIIIEWIQRSRQHAFDFSRVHSVFLRYAVYVATVVAIYFLMPQQKSEFIYFQF